MCGEETGLQRFVGPAPAYAKVANCFPKRLPPPITCPFLEVAAHVDLPPVATYSALNLWNWAPFSLDDVLSLPENLQSLHTFTGSMDEAWFYLISVAMEAKGAPVIPVMLECIEAARTGDSSTVAQCLNIFTEKLQDLGTLLERMYESCDPHVFYHHIRPFLAGWKGMAPAGLLHGVFYDQGNGKGQWRQYSGGSNAQSSLIQFFDIVLSVEHISTGQSCSPSAGTKTPHGFIQVSQSFPET
jgi:indoleamine 2,3-dioxygenase